MIVVDIEASGTDANKHSILSIGAIDFDNPSDRFYDECRAWEGAHLDPGAFLVNGFSEKEALDASRKSEADAVKGFIAWATSKRDWTFAGQNPSFDRGFIEAACRRAKIDYPFAHRTLDTHTLAYMHMITHSLVPPFDATHHRSDLDLDGILRYVGIPDEPTPHNALTGAECHAEVIARLLYGRQLLPEFEVFPIPWEVPRI